MTGGPQRRHLSLEVFAQTKTHTRLRLSETQTQSGPLDRPLDEAALATLVDAVVHDYEGALAAHQPFGSAVLRDLGEHLDKFFDGDERWYDLTLTRHRDGVDLHITTDQHLDHLPWELLHHDGSYPAVSHTVPLLPLRTPAGNRDPLLLEPANRPLRVLFMAASPLDGGGAELDFEQEEATFWQATAGQGLDVQLVVEESGTLDGLRDRIVAYGAGYFDVLHLSGHAGLDQGQPVFILEDAVGKRQDVSPEQIADALAGQWPRLVFLSGCLTASGAGSVPSMGEVLVRSGAGLVLGWALKVGDTSATLCAAELYRALAQGQAVDRAIVQARQVLYDQHSPYWHMLRAYSDTSPLTPVVTPHNQPGRQRSTTPPADQAFLDPLGQRRVASRTEFVGRRRVVQRCLARLTQPIGAPEAAAGLVLHGMGGLGKSTLACRLLDRLETYQRAVWIGQVDLTQLQDLPSKIELASLDDVKEAAAILADDQVDLTTRLRYLLSGPLARTKPCLFVFDDFENGNLDQRGSSHSLTSKMAGILSALLTAIRQTDSPSRVIITSRYQFDPPSGARLWFEPLETLTRVEQAKKLARLTNLAEGSPVDPSIRQRAVEAAAGNPRLLEWLDAVVGDPELDADGCLRKIEGTTENFRLDILARELLDALPVPARTMLARLDVVELPVPASTVVDLHPDPDRDQHLARTVALGLLEQGTDPATGAPRYHVSDVLHPLLEPLLPSDDRVQACATAASSLNRRWADPDDSPNFPATVDRWVEVHRLAVVGHQAQIARPLGDRIARLWLATSRFHDVARLAQRTLSLGPDAGALYDLGWALRATGSPGQALDSYTQALDLYRTQGERPNEAATMNNIGLVYQGRGDLGQALHWFELALPIRREVGDRAGEAATMNNIGLVYQGRGDLGQALHWYELALPIRREVGDRAGEAATLFNIAMVHRDRGDVCLAVSLMEQVVALDRAVGHPDLAADTAVLAELQRLCDEE